MVTQSFFRRLTSVPSGKYNVQIMTAKTAPKHIFAWGLASSRDQMFTKRPVSLMPKLVILAKVRVGKGRLERTFMVRKTVPCSVLHLHALAMGCEKPLRDVQAEGQLQHLIGRLLPIPRKCIERFQVIGQLTFKLQNLTM